MAKRTIFKLHFQTPLHVSIGKSSYDSTLTSIESDTLSAALASLKAQQGANSAQILSFLDSFTISSAFPYVERFYFLPKPKVTDKILIDGKESHQYRKQLKDVEFLELSVWKEWVSGLPANISPEQLLQNNYILPLGTQKEDFVKPFETQVSQRVTVSRDGIGEATPFYFEWIYFNQSKECGLYIIVEAKEPSVINELYDLLSTLGDFGIGTDRSVGGGHFTVTTDQIDWPEIQDSNAQISLSLYHPSETELDKLHLPKANYSILLRGGFMAGSTDVSKRHLWKRSVYMFGVGSVFPTIDRLEGDIVDLRPEWNEPLHPVFRSGKALFVPIKAKLL